MTPDWITVRVTLKTAPLEQWGVAREMRQRIKARFDHEGIELARPARVLIHRDAHSEGVEPSAGTGEPAGVGRA
jgi:small conductance mechanosensitive channel